MTINISGDKIHYPCGCSFDIIPGSNPIRIKFDPHIDNIPLNCSATWDLIGQGNTKGVFQLESRFGQQYAKKLKPNNIEHLAALSAILRPGCVSKDSKIFIDCTTDKKGHTRWKRVKISDLFNKFSSSVEQYVLSYDEDTNEIVKNKLLAVIHQGVRPVVKLKYRRQLWASRKRNNPTFKCTTDHPLYVLGRGWVKLEDMVVGDRFAVIERQSKKQKSFQQICFDAYHYKCIFCDWSDGPLDVNHIDGNRKVNNDPDNLCFMCPNHHRMYSVGKISKDKVINWKSEYTITPHKNLCWCIYEGYEDAGIEEVYDLSVASPHHSFIADGVIVHNCTQAIRDGKNVADHYIDRKNGVEEVTYFHPVLEDILGSTFGEMIYQEQAMRIAQVIAGFSLEQADNLRKAIGKKKADIMAQVKVEFLEGCKKTGIVTDEQAEELFGWIEKSQRYSFNKSHAVSYAINGYLSAYAKAHFPTSFFTSYLYFSKDKQDTFDEIKLLVANAKVSGINIYPPDFRRTNTHFKRFNDTKSYDPYGDSIYFGFADIKGIGEASIKEINTAIFQIEMILGKTRDKWTWSEFLIFFSQSVKSTSVISMIESGAVDYFKIDRKRMLYEYEIYSQLSDKPKAWIKQNLKVANMTLLDIMKVTFDWYSSPESKNTKLRPYHTSVQLNKAKELFDLLNKPPYKLIDTPEWKVRVEEARLGIALTTSLLDGCIDACYATCTCLQFLNKEEPKDGNIFMAVQIDDIKTHIANNGEEMAFITISDNDASLDGVVFSKDWENIKQNGVCVKENTVMITAQRSNRDSLIIKNMLQLA